MIILYTIYLIKKKKKNQQTTRNENDKVCSL